MKNSKIISRKTKKSHLPYCPFLIVCSNNVPTKPRFVLKIEGMGANLTNAVQERYKSKILISENCSIIV